MNPNALIDSIPAAPSPARWRGVVLAGALAVACLTACAYWAVYLLGRVVSSTEWVNHTVEVRGQVEQIRAEFEGLERWSAVSWDDEETHQAMALAVASLVAQAHHLQSLVADNPQQLAAVQRVSKALRTLQLGDGAAVLQLRLQPLQAGLDAMLAREEASLVLRQKNYEASVSRQRQGIVLLGSLALAAFLLAVFSLWREACRRAEAEATAREVAAALQALNFSLEERV